MSGDDEGQYSPGSRNAVLESIRIRRNRVLSKYSISLKKEWVTGAASPDLPRPFCAASGCYDGLMRLALDPFRLLLISLAGWLNQQQQDVIDYLQQENRVLREQLGGKRLRFSDDQRRRLAVRAKKLGWRMLNELTTIVTQQRCWAGIGG